MTRRHPIQDPPLTMRGPYIVEGDLLLDRYEWAGGHKPDEKTLTARRREVREATVKGEPMPGLIDDEVQVLRPSTDEEILALRAASPIRAKVDSADLSDTPLFGQQTLL